MHAPTLPPRHHARISQLAREDDDEDEDAVAMGYPKSKGKGRAVNDRQTQDSWDDEVEDEIA